VLRNALFVSMSVLNGALMSWESLLNVIFPLWLLTYTEAPAALVAALFVLNAIFVSALQVRASRGASTLSGAGSSALRSGAIVAVACLVMAGTSSTGVVTTAVLATVAYLLLSTGEILHSASDWGAFGALSDQGRRGEYQSVWSMGAQSARMIAIPGYTALVSLNALGFVPIAAIFLLLGITMSRALSYREHAAAGELRVCT
jgi:hypothetical protein